MLGDIVGLDRKPKTGDRRLNDAVAATGTGLPDLYGVGPVGAARMLGDVARFRSKAHFASWTGIAPIDASSGQPGPAPAVPRPAGGSTGSRGRVGGESRRLGHVEVLTSWKEAGRDAFG